MICILGPVVRESSVSTKSMKDDEAGLNYCDSVISRAQTWNILRLAACLQAEGVSSDAAEGVRVRWCRTELTMESYMYTVSLFAQAPHKQ